MDARSDLLSTIRPVFVLEPYFGNECGVMTFDGSDW
jgi:hypothetical protein